MSEENKVQGTTEQSVESKKTAKPVVKKDKPSFFKRVAKWFKDLRSEAKKVVWPAKKQVVNNTIVVIIAVVIVAIFVYILDVTFGTIRDFLATIL